MSFLFLGLVLFLVGLFGLWFFFFFAGKSITDLALALVDSERAGGKTATV